MAWYIWLSVSIIFMILEIPVPGFYMLMIGLGFLFSVIVSLFVSSFAVQILAGALGIVLMTVLARPVLIRSRKKLNTNAEAMIGRTVAILSPVDATGKYDVIVGRIRQDISRSDKRGIEMFVSGDQLLKGAALNAVQIAEVLNR